MLIKSAKRVQDGLAQVVGEGFLCWSLISRGPGISIGTLRERIRVGPVADQQASVREGFRGTFDPVDGQPGVITQGSGTLHGTPEQIASACENPSTLGSVLWLPILALVAGHGSATIG
jgi:hypothetical protein